MANQRIDGLLLPVPVAHHPALELCNTRAGWFTATPREYLVGYPELAVWARENGLVDESRTDALLREARRHPDQAAATLRAALRYRTLLHRAMVDDGPDGSKAAAAALHSVARALASADCVGGHGSGWSVVPTSSLRAPLDAFAMAALPLLQDGRSSEVGYCPGVGCGWLFHDPTRRRRWCVMSICGNRAKARSWAKRRRAEALATRR